jgi:tetratricopeptide (TPR) repeat protein
LQIKDLTNSKWLSIKSLYIMLKRKGNFRNLISVLVMALITITLNAQTINEVIESFNAGAAEVTAGNYEAAIASFETTIEQATALGAEGDDMKVNAEGQIPPLYYRMAMDTYKAKDIPGAIVKFEETVAASEKYGNNDVKEKSLKYIPQLYNSNGNTQLKAGDFEGAIASFDKAVEYQPDYAKAIYGKGLVYRKQKDQENMVATLEKAIEVGNAAGDEQTVSAATKLLIDGYVNAGKLAFKNENYADAISNFESSFKYDPENAEAYYLICVIQGRQGDFEKAVETGAKALEYEEDDADKKARVYYEVGNAYVNLVEYDKACAAFKNCLVEPYTASVKHQMDNVLKCQ